MDQVRKTFRVYWYRCPIERDVLRKLTRRSDIKGFFQTLGHLALVAVTGYFVFRFFYSRSWVGFALALWLHGTFLTFFAMSAVHELAHNTVFRTKWLNVFFLWVYSLPGWFNFYWYKISHTYHHKYTLHPKGDREVTLPKKPSLNIFYLLQLFTVNVTGGFESVGILPIIGGTLRLAFTGKFGVMIGVSDNWLEAIFTPDMQAERRKAVAFARFLVLFHLIVIVVSVVFGLWPLMLVVTFGTFIGNGVRYFIGVPMHVGLRTNVPDFRKCVRTITLDPLSAFLYWRMHWHIEHHMYAAVPCYNLRKLHRAVSDDMPEKRTLVGAWREMRATWRKQKEDPEYQFDTPVPSGKGAAPNEADPLAASLGDLGPKGMSD
jgi:fatty acid desaturase